MNKKPQIASHPVQPALACPRTGGHTRPTLNCRQAFTAGKVARSQYPLTSGSYKLMECAARFESFVSAIAQIRAFINNEANRWELLHCTAQDKDVWLKGLPSVVAHRLGYELLPGLQAMQLDGVASQIVQDALHMAESQCDDLIQRLEPVRLTLESSIDWEYQAMRRGSSLIEPLVRDALELTQKSLSIKQYITTAK